MTKVPIIRTTVTAAYIGPGDVIVVYNSRGSAQDQDHLLYVQSVHPSAPATGKISLLCNYPDHGTVIVERLPIDPVRVVSLSQHHADQLLPSDIIHVGTGLYTVRQVTHGCQGSGNVTVWTDAIALHYTLADKVDVVNWTMVCDGTFQVTNGPAAVDLSRYPHTCPRCGDAAYIGAGGPADCIRGDKCK